MPKTAEEGKRRIFDGSAEKTPHYGFRKVSAGVASVLLSTTLWMGKTNAAHAATEPDAAKNATDSDSSGSDEGIKTESGLVISKTPESTDQAEDGEKQADDTQEETVNDTPVKQETQEATQEASEESMDAAQDDSTKQAKEGLTEKNTAESGKNEQDAGSIAAQDVSTSHAGQNSQEQNDAKANTAAEGNAESTPSTSESEELNDNAAAKNNTADESNAAEGNAESASSTSENEVLNGNAADKNNTADESNAVDGDAQSASSTSESEAIDDLNTTTVSSAQLLASSANISRKMLSVSLAAANDVKEVHIKSQEDLDKFLAQNGTNLSKTNIYFENSGALKWPSATYTMSPAGVNSHFYFTAASTGDIDFNGSVFAIDHGGDFQWSSMQGDHKGQTIKNAYIYGSTSNGNAAAFIWFFVRASNQTVSNMHFYNAQKMASHILDIDGASNITVENNEFAGYGVGDISDADIVAQQAKDFHNMYAEAIQIDNAKDQMNADTKTDTSGVYQESATNITVRNNVFTNYRGKTGAAIVHNTGETVYDHYASTGVGQHMTATKQLAEATGIKIYNNVFFNTIPEQNPSSTEKNGMHQSPSDMHVLFYPVHEQLTKNSTTVGNHTYYTVENNAFVNLKNGNYATQDGKEFAINSATAFIGWAGSGGAGNKSYHVDSDTLSAKAVSWNGNTVNFNLGNNSYGVDKLPSDPMPSSSTSENLSHTVNRTIEYKTQGGNHPAPGAVHDSLTFNGTKTTDKYTGKTSENWDGNKDFADVASPGIQGYTPDRAVVSNKNIAHDAGDIHEVVTYRADNQKVHVVFHDDTANKDIKTTDLNGESDTPAFTNDGGWHAYTTANEINAYKGQGYELVSDDTNGQQIMLDHDTGKDQVFTVHLKHVTRTVKVGDDVNRTINYVMKDGSPASAQVKDSIHFDGTQTVDGVTNQALGTTWDGNKDFADVASPRIQGYTPDRAVVSNKNVAHDAGDIHEVVTYKADNQKVHVVFHDDTANKDIKTTDLNGESDTPAFTNDGGWHAYTTANEINAYKGQGYELVSDDTNGQQIMLDHDTGKDQVFTVHLKHVTRTVKVGDDVNRTINYVMKDGSPAPAQVKDSIHFDGTQTVDGVTNQALGTTWDGNKDFADVSSPAVKGYTPDRKSVSNKGIAHDAQDVSETVTYAPDPQTAVISYVDQTTGDLLRADTIFGVTHGHSGYSTKANIQHYLDNGYELVSDDTKGNEIIYDDDDAAVQNFTVTLKHVDQTITENSPATPGAAINKDENGAKYPAGVDKASLVRDVIRTVSYSMSDGSQAPAQVKDVLHFASTKVVDKATGRVLSTVWPAKQDFKDAISPVVKGYTPSQNSIVNHGIAYSSDSLSASVSYTPDPQKATVTYVDQTTGKTLAVKTLSGVTNAKSGYSTKASIQDYLDNGYELVSDDTKGNEVAFDNEDATDQAYTVILKHTYVTVDEDHAAVPGKAINKNAGGVKYPAGTDKASLGHDVKRSIVYKTTDNSQAPGSVESTLHFTAKKVVDRVTGEVVSTEWSPAQDYDDVESPAVTGYTPDQTAVSNKQIVHDAKDIVKTVSYAPDPQKATVAYVDATTGKTIKTDTLSGYSNGPSRYFTTNVIQALKKAGYVLLSDDTHGQIFFDNYDAADQAHVVKLAHRIDNFKQTDEIVRRIRLHEPNGKTKTVQQSAVVWRKVMTDAVTGQRSFGEWTSARWKAYDVPKLNGCKASLSKLSEKPVAHGTKDESVDVYYKIDPAFKNEAGKSAGASPVSGSSVVDSVAGSAVDSAAGSASVAAAGSNFVPSSCASSSPSLPQTGNSRDAASLTAGTFAVGTSLLATVLKRRFQDKKQ